MELYLFTPPYDDEKVSAELIKLGFQRGSLGEFCIGNRDDFIVNLSHYAEASGKDMSVQLQGDQVEDLWKNGKCSKYYLLLEKLARIFSPKRIVDPLVRDVPGLKECIESKLSGFKPH